MRLTWVLSREGEDARTPGNIYLAVVQLVLLYRSEPWVLKPRMQRVLVSFHHRVARRLTGRQPRKGRGRGWVYLLLEDNMVEAGLQQVETYVSCHQNTLVQYIETKPIMELCLAEKRRPGIRVAMQWR